MAELRAVAEMGAGRRLGALRAPVLLAAALALVGLTASMKGGILGQ